MVITIFDRVGNPRADISPGDSSTQAMEIQGDNVLTLSFTYHDHIPLDVDDYVDFEGERYWLTEAYRPVQKSTKEWGYDIKLYGIQSLIRNFLVIKRVDGEDDPVFTLTAPPREHVAMIVNCMNDGAGHVTDWKVGQVDGTENIVIDYHGKYCDEALKEIAEKVGAEWWIEGQTVNVCRCEHGEPVVLGYDKGLTGITPDKADNVKFYTRLYPVGSSRNIDREKYGFSRLQLPGGQKYVEVNADKYGRVDHYEADAFAHLYPRRVGEVSSVRSEVRTGKEGSPFTAYYFSDNDLPFDPNDYKMGVVMRVSFQEGSELGGLGEEENGAYYFEVNYNSDTREFEIITIWPYDNDVQLPGGTLVPKAGDKYILWNLRMPDEYYSLAEEELLTAVNKYNEDHGLDVTVFKAPTDHVWIEDNNVELFIGRRVRLESEHYFPGAGYRDSRITKITRRVNLPSSMDIEIGDALSRTAMQKMTDNISDARNYAKSIAESASLPDIVHVGDSTRLTDNNLLSALRTLREIAELALSRQNDDSASGLVTFLKGLVAEEVARLRGGAEFGDYVGGFRGAGVDSAGNGDFESITSRSFLKVYEHIYNRLNALEGDTSFADVGTIERVAASEPDGEGNVAYTADMRKRWEGDFTAFQPGDVVYGYVNDLSNAGAKTWGKAWAWVDSVDRGANTLRLYEYPGDMVPAGVNLHLTEGMLISRWGNRIEPNMEAAANPDYSSFIRKKRGGGYVNTRQQSFFISCESGNLVQLTGVDRPILKEGNYGTVLGQLPEGLVDSETAKYLNDGQPYLYARGIVVQDIIRINYKGVKTVTPNFRGIWSAETAASKEEYYREADDMGDVVSHTGSLWQCRAPRASARPPSDGNAEWVRLTSKPVSDWRIIPSVNVVYIRRGKPSTDTLACTVRHYGADGVKDYTTPEALDETGASLMFAMDGEQYREFWVRDGETLAGLDLEDGSGSIDMGGNNVPWMEITDHIHLYVIDKASGVELTAYTVAVVRDGEDGGAGTNGRDGTDGRDGGRTEFRFRITASDETPDRPEAVREPEGWGLTHKVPGAGERLWQSSAEIDGEDGLAGEWSAPVCMSGIDGKPGTPGAAGKDGAQGKPGPMVYPAGAYNSHTEYEATEKARPVVMDGRDGQGLGQYFALKSGTAYCGDTETERPKTPHEDAALGGQGAKWEKMDRFSMIFTDILMAEFAKLASAVFSGDLMFSQQGVDGQGLFSNSYQDIGGGFTPNFMVDFLTGRLYASRATVKGHIEADSGTFCGTLRARDGYFSGVLRQSPTVITPDNCAEYADGGEAVPLGLVLDWDRVGTALRLEGDFREEAPYLVVRLPSGMEYLGNTFRVENASTVPLTVEGTLYQDPPRGDAHEVDERAFLYPQRGISLTCEVLPAPGARPGADPANPEDLRDTRLRLMWRHAGIYVLGLT